MFICERYAIENSYKKIKQIRRYGAVIVYCRGLRFLAKPPKVYCTRPRKRLVDTVRTDYS